MAEKYNDVLYVTALKFSHGCGFDMKGAFYA